MRKSGGVWPFCAFHSATVADSNIAGKHVVVTHFGTSATRKRIRVGAEAFASKL